MANRIFRFSTFLSLIALIFLPIQPAQATNLKIAIVYADGGRGDNGPNDLAAVGLEKAISKNKLSRLDIREQITNGTLGDRITRVRFLAKNNYQLIICIGSAYADTVKRISNEFPNTQFAIIDDESVAMTNVSNLSFANKEAFYVAGAALALASKSAKISFIADKADLTASTYLLQFTKGALSVNPKVKISNLSIDQNSSDDIKRLIADGNDQIFSIWSKSDLVISTIAAANSKTKKVLISGVIPDQFFLNFSAGKKNQYLVIKKRYDIAVEQMITAQVADKNLLDILDETKGIYGHRYNLKEAGISIALTSGSSLPPKVEAVTSAIKAGKLKP
ncbi:MAG: BMP family ABC transporter substrate-binding protein [Actinobacteria bacterium]|nr:BMP family ABC transporter substrate-binding protein [Actinomycetota bacterium]